MTENKKRRISSIGVIIAVFVGLIILVVLAVLIFKAGSQQFVKMNKTTEICREFGSIEYFEFDNEKTLLKHVSNSPFKERLINSYFFYEGEVIIIDFNNVGEYYLAKKHAEFMKFTIKEEIMRAKCFNSTEEIEVEKNEIK